MQLQILNHNKVVLPMITCPVALNISFNPSRPSHPSANNYSVKQVGQAQFRTMTWFIPVACALLSVAHVDCSGYLDKRKIFNLGKNVGTQFSMQHRSHSHGNCYRGISADEILSTYNCSSEDIDSCSALTFKVMISAVLYQRYLKMIHFDDLF